MDEHDLTAETDEDDVGQRKPHSLLLRVAIVIGMLATAAGAMLGPFAPTPAPAQHTATPAHK